MSGGTVHSGGPSLSGLSPQASSFFSALLAQDARASNSCLSHEEQQQEQGAASRDLPSNSACSMLQQQQTVKEASESPFNAGQNRHQENTLADTLREQGGEVAGAVTISAPPEFIVVSAESFVQYLINDLRKGCRVSSTQFQYSTKRELCTVLCAPRLLHFPLFCVNFYYQGVVECSERLGCLCIYNGP